MGWQLSLAKGSGRDDRPAIIPLREGTTTLGRERGDADVFLDSEAFPKLISRLHARVTVKGDEVVLQDCSVNGCSVDGSAVRRVVLAEGCTVVLGSKGSSREFVYKLQRTSEAEAEAEGAARKRARTGAAPASPTLRYAGPAAAGLPEGAQPTGSEPVDEAEVEGVMMDELQCCVCRELLCRPHALPCSHTFCGGCIFQWAKREQRLWAKRPTLRRAHHLHECA